MVYSEDPVFMGECAEHDGSAAVAASGEDERR
jgi:hypothetical protein